MLDISRRSLLVGGIATLITAPAIVRATSIMSVKSVTWPANKTIFHIVINDRASFRWIVKPGNEIFSKTGHKLCGLSYSPPIDTRNQPIDIKLSRKPDGFLELPPKVWCDFITPAGDTYSYMHEEGLWHGY